MGCHSSAKVYFTAVTQLLSDLARFTAGVPPTRRCMVLYPNDENSEVAKLPRSGTSRVHTRRGTSVRATLVDELRRLQSILVVLTHHTRRGRRSSTSYVCNCCIVHPCSILCHHLRDTSALTIHVELGIENQHACRGTTRGNRGRDPTCMPAEIAPSADTSARTV